MAKYRKLALFTLFFAFLLTGCANIDLHLTVNSDGTGTIKVKMVGSNVDESILETSFEREKAYFEKGGYKIRKIEENGVQG